MIGGPAYISLLLGSHIQTKGELIVTDPAYMIYIQDRVTKATLQEAEAQEIMEIGKRILCSGDKLDQIRRGEGLADCNDHHYVPGMSIEHPMTGAMDDTDGVWMHV